MAHDIPGFGKAFKSSVRKYYPALLSIGGFGEVLPRKENRVSLDAEVKDAWGIPVLRFDYRFGDNEIKMAKDMARHRRGDAARGGRGEHQDRARACCPRAGRSTRSAPRAWATIRRRR